MSCLESRASISADPGVDHGLGVLGHLHRPGHDLVDELADQVAGDGPLLVVAGQAALGDDLVEQARFLAWLAVRPAGGLAPALFGGTAHRHASFAAVEPRPVSLLSFFSDVGVADRRPGAIWSSLSLPSILFSRFVQPFARLQQLAEGLDLPDDLLGLEVVDVR